MHNVLQGSMSTPDQRLQTRRQEEVAGRIPAINHINQGPAGTQLLLPSSEAADTKYCDNCTFTCRGLWLQSYVWWNFRSLINGELQLNSWKFASLVAVHRQRSSPRPPARYNASISKGREVHLHWLAVTPWTELCLILEFEINGDWCFILKWQKRYD